jgi:hypothetical protein
MALMNGQGHKWLTSSRMAHYQGLLCENPHVRLETLQTLNPATFLSTEEWSPDHDCEEVMDKVYSSKPDLMDAPRSDPELELFMELGLMATPLGWSPFHAPTGPSIWPLHSQCHNSLH